MTAVLADTLPIPLPTRVVLRAAPRCEPPFDDELEAPLAGPLDRHLPFAPVRPAPAPWRPIDSGDGPQPDPAIWARRLLVGMIETAGGRRPLRQISSFLSPSVNHGLGAEFSRANIAGSPHWLTRASVRSVRACRPADGIAELSAVLDVGLRSRAVAMRIEEHRGRWCCTRLQIG